MVAANTYAAQVTDEQPVIRRPTVAGTGWASVVGPGQAAGVGTGQAAGAGTGRVRASARVVGRIEHEAGARRVTDEKQDEATDKPRGRAAFWKELVILVGVAVLVATLVKAFLVQTFYIPSGSMEHTLDLNDRVLVNKLVYDFRDPARGEIIVFAAPAEWRSRSTDEDFIKRVIGVGGDNVVCCDEQGRIMVNGKSLDEPYLHRNADGVPDPASRDPFNVVVPQGRLWVMGDHRSESGDSREHYRNTGNIELATIPVDSVVGRAFVLFWPPSRATWLTVPDTFNDIPPPAGR
jgi:signal peptidase I